MAAGINQCNAVLIVLMAVRQRIKCYSVMAYRNVSYLCRGAQATWLYFMYISFSSMSNLLFLYDINNMSPSQRSASLLRPYSYILADVFNVRINDVWRKYSYLLMYGIFLLLARIS